MPNNMERKPILRFPEFTDDWEQRKLGDIFEYEQPGPYIVSSTEYSDNFTTPVLTAGQSFILGYTNEKKGIKTATSENPVIIFDDFTTTSHLVNFNFKVKSSAIKILSLNNKKDNIYCANSVLKNIRYIPANHERHWISKFANFSVFMPSCLEEQKKIGDFIKLFDELIDLYYKKIQILKRIKKGFLQKLFPKKDEINPELRFPGFTDDWEHQNLGFFFDERLERAKENEELLSVTISNGVIKQKYSEKRNVASEDKSNYKIVKKGDVPYNSMRMWQGAVGVSKYDGIVSPAYTVLVPKDITNGKFFMEFFKKDSTLEIFKRWSQGLTSDTWNLKFHVLSSIHCNAPSIEEQNKIAEFLFKLDQFIIFHQRKIEILQNIKKGLLQQMFV